MKGRIPKDEQRRSRGRGCLAAAGGVFFLFLLLILLRVPLLRAVGGFLVVDDAPARADLLYILNGDARESARAMHAASLFRDGRAPQIVIARVEDWPAGKREFYPNDTDVNLRILLAEGVPPQAIRVIRTKGGASSTRDEAGILRWYLEQSGVDTVMVVTSDYHTRRARWLMRRSLGRTVVELRMAAAPNPRFAPEDWWRSEEGMLAIVEEYLKFVHNRFFR